MSRHSTNFAPPQHHQASRGAQGDPNKGGRNAGGAGWCCGHLGVQPRCSAGGRCGPHGGCYLAVLVRMYTPYPVSIYTYIQTQKRCTLLIQFLPPSLSTLQYTHTSPLWSKCISLSPPHPPCPQMEALPEVVEAVGGQCEVYVDGGFSQ